MHKHHGQICDDPQCVDNGPARVTPAEFRMFEKSEVVPTAMRTVDEFPALARRYLEIESLRASGHVHRWHTVPIHGQQTDAEHSGQAVSLLLLLHPSPSLNLIKAMLWHDSSERVVGDAPSPGRRGNPSFDREYQAAEDKVMAEQHPTAFAAYNGLTDEERLWLKAVDVLELIMFCSDQIHLGNAPFGPIRELALGWLRQSRTPTLVLDFANHYMSQPGGPRSF